MILMIIFIFILTRTILSYYVRDNTKLLILEQ